jgi:hypothetical protein
VVDKQSQKNDERILSQEKMVSFYMQINELNHCAVAVS